MAEYQGTINSPLVRPGCAFLVLRCPCASKADPDHGPYPNSRYYGAFFFAADRFTFLPFWTHTLREGSYTYPSRHIPIPHPIIWAWLGRASARKTDASTQRMPRYQCSFHAILLRVEFLWAEISCAVRLWPEPQAQATRNYERAEAIGC